MIPQWQFKGTWFPKSVMLDMWRAYRDHGILYTEYIQQPPEWWKDINVLEDMRTTKVEENRPKEKPKPLWAEPKPLSEMVPSTRRTNNDNGR